MAASITITVGDASHSDGHSEENEVLEPELLEQWLHATQIQNDKLDLLHDAMKDLADAMKDLTTAGTLKTLCLAQIKDNIKPPNITLKHFLVELPPPEVYRVIISGRPHEKRTPYGRYLDSDIQPRNPEEPPTILAAKHHLEWNWDMPTPFTSLFRFKSDARAWLNSRRIRKSDQYELLEINTSVLSDDILYDAYMLASHLQVKNPYYQRNEFLWYGTIESWRITELKTNE